MCFYNYKNQFQGNIKNSIFYSQITWKPEQVRRLKILFTVSSSVGVGFRLRSPSQDAWASGKAKLYDQPLPCKNNFYLASFCSFSSDLTINFFQYVPQRSAGGVSRLLAKPKALNKEVGFGFLAPGFSYISAYADANAVKMIFILPPFAYFQVVWL